VGYARGIDDVHDCEIQVLFEAGVDEPDAIAKENRDDADDYLIQEPGL